MAIFALLASAVTAWAQQNAVSTLAGSGSVGSTDGTGSAASFQFTNPSGAGVDASGNVFVTDAANHTIRKVTPAGVVTTFAGTAGSSGTADGTGAAARFNQPRGIAVDGAGNIYVADTNNHTIRMITSGGVVTTIAGTAGSSGSANGTGAAARFNQPFGIAADRAGAGGAAVNLFVADTQNHTIRQIVVATGAVTTLAGTAGNSGSTNGTGAAALFNHPDALVANTAGTTVFVADTFNHLIRQIVVSSAAVTTLAGSGSAGTADGTGAAASFNNPAGISLDGAGNVLVADTFSHTIRRVTSGGVVTTIAGSPNSSGTTNGLDTAARFNFPSGIAFDLTSGTNNVTYVVDTNNQLVRKIAAAQAPSITTQPGNASAAVGGNASFTVVASGNPPVSYQWQIQPGGSGSFTNLSASSTYTGVTSATLTVNSVTAAMNGDRFQVVVSNGVGTAATSSAATLTVTSPPVFTSANSASFVAGQTTNFQVSVTGSPTPTVSATGIPSWASFNTSTRVLTGSPIASDSSATITFTATNSAGTTQQTFSANVVNTFLQISGPVNQTVASGGTTASFTVTASGSPTDFTYQWQRSTDGGASFANLSDATIDGATYTGTTTTTLVITGITPAMNGYQYRVIVRNNGGANSQTGTATLFVAPIITSQSSATFVSNQNTTFTFAASGNPAPTFSVTGTLPTGVSFTGTGLAGTPTDTTNQSYFLTVTATNSGGTASQSFTLNVVAQAQAPTFTSPTAATFTINQFGSHTFVATGAPTPTIQLSGNLPTGVTFNTQTGVLSGTPTTADGSPFTLTATATNTSGTAVQTFVLSVLGIAPTITTQPTNVTASIGGTVTFTAAVSGSPTPTLRWQRQPNGTSGFVSLTDDGTFSGTTTGTLTITNVGAALNGDQFRLVANNGTGGDVASNAATLTVNLGTVFTTVAGLQGFTGAIDATGINARFNSPSGIAVDFSGNAYVADTANHVIRKVSPSGVVTTIAGLAGFAGSADGVGSAARFNAPQGIAVDGALNIYVADTFNHTIRVVSQGGNVTTLAGLAGSSGAINDVGSSARFSSPTGVAVDNTGTVYVADSNNHAIRRVINNGTVSTYAGALGSAGYLDANPATSARFNTPQGVTVDSFGNVYVADTQNYVIRRIAAGGGAVTTLAGSAGAAGVSDGNGSLARFNRPIGIASDSTGSNIYVADTFSSTIRKVTSAGDVTTIGGLPLSPGASDGAGSTARFNSPQGIAVDSVGNIYVADTRNHTIRRTGTSGAPAIQQQPVDRTSPIGGSVSFTVSASGTPTPGYVWQRQRFGTIGFATLTNDTVFTGVNTTTLTINNVTLAMSGDQFRAVINNGAGVVTSNAATLTVGTAPVFTSGTTATFRAGEANSFSVAVTSDPAATFSLSGNPSWLTINSSTGVISGTPPDTTGSPLSVTVTANNGISASQTIVITILPAQVAPTISAQPVNATVDQGASATFSVTATGLPAPTYQWRRNELAISGATNASLTLSNVQPADAGFYSVIVRNVAGTIISNSAALAVNTSPVITVQPRAQVALAGSSVTFSVAATGGAGLSYQWRKNGGNIPGANGSAFTIASVGAGDAGNYDVIVSNSLGGVLSSTAQLSLVTANTAASIVAQPASRTAVVGSSVILSVGATGVPAPTYQWRKNGANISGANGATLTIAPVAAGDAAFYDVVVTNAVGSVTSNPALVRVIARSYAGVYFGQFSGGQGEFALLVREDNTGVFLGYLPGSVAPVLSLNVSVNDAGQFSFSQNAIAAAAAAAGEPSRAAALAPVTVTGTIGTDGSVSGSTSGGATASLAGVRAANSGPSQAFTGFYQAGATNNAATVYTIASADGRAFVVEQSGTASDGGRGLISSSGSVTVSTGRSVIAETIAPGGILTGTSSGAVVATFNGGSDVVVGRQRLLNISSRTRVDAGASVAIAGFVIAGEESKPVLIRAVGPTLGAAPFNVSGALASPRLELFRSGASTAFLTNTGIGTNRAAIDAAGQQAGAFALGAAGTDAAILTTLAPGAYTAVVSSTTNATGVALVEVYDLSPATPGQKLLNISTRAAAGTAENTLIAGFVVPPGSAKRVLIRGIGPGLAQFGVSGTLANPVLTLLSGSTTVASNTGYTTSADRADITLASVAVGGFTMANADSALLVTLPPGNYTAQVLGTNNATGVALIEVYEVP